ncbi:hypothetical protein SKAU_G00290810 [Synaphobranchus kaupii]|uniref:Uncharacterized protein n=1 Tax=Synaphobranchus kaupii TaxID=118154 RepID=A0A9Q1ETS4_SYNKA|nr:hypothetical protein SKAU_G00290810 [Synaphobranchus kaupii]
MAEMSEWCGIPIQGPRELLNQLNNDDRVEHLANRPSRHLSRRRPATVCTGKCTPHTAHQRSSPTLADDKMEGVNLPLTVHQTTK